MLMRKTLQMTAIVFMLTAATTPRAQEAQDVPALTWQCTQLNDAQYNVHCIARTSLQAPTSPTAAGAPNATGNPPVPGAIDLRPVAQRGNAAVFAPKFWRVPLHSPPSNASRVATLLQSVLCGNREQCSVDYGPAGAVLARR